MNAAMNEEDFLGILQQKTRGVAIFGPSAKRGFYWIKSLMSMSYDGAIVPIHLKLVAAAGIPCYASLDDVPESIKIDYAIIAVSKPSVIDCLQQCIKHRVKVATIFTSGYSEQDPVEGRKQEQEIIDVLEKGYKETGRRLRVLGPNCMGVYYPKNGLSFRTDLSNEPGNVGIISQSGGLAINITLRGKLNGIKFSKVVSLGNSIDLKPAEIIRLMTMDKDTKVIGCYFESLGKTTQESRDLFEVVKQAAHVKPVLIWRGGRSERGAVAASSHTGALKTSSQMWEAFVKQSGVISTSSFEEFMDTLLALQFLGNKVPGKRIGLISISGGSAVTATDEIMDAGLELPMLAPDTQKSILSKAVADVGISTKNPVDLGNSYFGFSIIAHTVDQILQDPNIDILFFEISTHYIYNATVIAYKDFASLYYQEALKSIKEAKRKTKKLVFIVMPEIAYDNETINDKQLFLKNNVPVYPTMHRAVCVVRNLVKYTSNMGSRV